MSRIRVERALVSVSDKQGLVELGKRLTAAGVEIVSSGGTARALDEAGVPVVRVEEVTGSPEMLGGRVKTLHPLIHGGILADPSDADHRADMDEHGVRPFQLVVVNLYPFEEALRRGDLTDREMVEEIDIGGPAMVRAAAKNHSRVGVVTRPDQYDEVLQEVEGGGLDEELRKRLAAEAFFHTAAYDAAIVSWLHPEDLPERIVLPLRRQEILRYGENPHQPGASYHQEGADPWWREARFLQGKAMSFNNHIDAEAAWRLVNRFTQPAAVIVKHTNACGVAVGPTLEDSFRRAWDCDPQSAFGGVVALNRPLDVATAREISTRFVEVVAAPEVDGEAEEVLAEKASLRLLAAPLPSEEGLDFRRLDGGFVAQVRDRVDPAEDWEVVSEREPSPSEKDDLRFAWVVAAATKSNAIVVARQGAAVGVGAGDQSRIGAARRALERAGERAEGAVAASDAFFPFPDGLEALAAAGVTAVVEPGGSRRDREVVEAADRLDVALLFTGRRHFLH